MSWRNRIVEQHNVPTSEIAAHDLNWRAHPQVQEAALSGVLAEVGLVQSVVRNLRRVESGWPADSKPTLVDGHLRLKLAVDAGEETLPVVDVDLSPDEERLILASFDPISALAQTNAELLAQVVEGLATRQAGMEELLARHRELLAGMLRKPPAADPGPQIDRAAELAEKWGVEPGQLWVTEGKHGTVHRLLCGDCRKPEDVSRLLGDVRVSIGFTSPPYAAQRAYDRASEFKPIPPGEYVTWFEAVQQNVRSHLAPDGSWFVNIKAHSEDGQRHLYVADLLLAHVRRWGWRFVDDLCWVRAGVPGSWPNRFKNGWEPIYHFCIEAQIKFRPDAVSTPTEHAFLYSPGQQVGGRSKNNSLRSERGNGKSVSGSGLLGKEHAAGFHEGLARPSNVIEVGSGGGQVSGQHPAEFPVGLPRWFILAYSDPGDAVYEPFAGSGATLLAAEQTGRAGYGMEISPSYTAVILERLEVLGLAPRQEKMRT